VICCPVHQFDRLTSVDPTFLAGILGQILKSVKSSEVLLAWTEFLCSSDLLFEESFLHVVEPSCQILLLRIRENIHLKEQSHEGECFTLTILSSVCDILSYAATPGIKSASSTIAIQKTKPTAISGTLLRQQSFDHAITELQLNPVTALIPALLIEICIFLKQMAAADTRSRVHLLQLCEKIYTTNPLTTLYYITLHLGTRIEQDEGHRFIIDTHFAILFDATHGPFKKNLSKNILATLRGIRDAKIDPYSKLYVIIGY
jgi:hypothetical protein